MRVLIVFVLCVDPDFLVSDRDVVFIIDAVPPQECNWLWVLVRSVLCLVFSVCGRFGVVVKCTHWWSIVGCRSRRCSRFPSWRVDLGIA